MIKWLVQSTAAHPALALAQPPAGLLHPVEQAHFARLKSEKRRREWLLGRWTAKQLLHAVVEPPPRPDALLITPNGDGAPEINLPWELSISHSHDYAFCAAAPAAYGPIGADIEKTVPRLDTFVADYFTPAEECTVSNAPPDARDRVITTIWSGKEAALKALQFGLRVDTRSVTCHVQPAASSPAAWASLAITLDSRYLDRPVPHLQGWWRVWNGFVLTLAARRM